MASGKAKSSWWAATMSVDAGKVDALKLKDRHAGLCRWNHAFRSVQQRAGNAAARTGACGKTKPVHSASGAAARRAKQDAEELRTVMYLTNWGPNN